MKKLIALILLFACGTATAIPLEWTLNDVLLDDGQYLTGQFTYDADTNTYSNLSITSPEPPWWLGLTEYTFTSSVNPSDAESILMGRNPSGFNGSHYVNLFFDSALTNQGGNVALRLNGYSREEFDETNYGGGVLDRFVVSGSVSAVPVPAAAWLFGSGLGLLGWFRRRRS